ncbi:hypothetical protein G6F24_014255 [Rhizopus arrhizus]|nr:hypothetical protein G6F24_014255 [Rhizopus arrhizus]
MPTAERHTGQRRHHHRGEQRGRHRRASTGVDLGQPARQQAIAAHHEEDAALAVQEGQQHGRQGDDRDHADHHRCGRVAQLAHDQGQRLGAVAEHRVAHRTDCRQRHQHVDDGAADHRTDDADRQVAARVLGFLGGGGDRIEAVEGEEDDCRRCHHAVLDAIGADRLGEAVGHERLQVGAVEGGQGDGDEDGQRDQLEHHQDGVEGGALLGAGHQHAGHQPGDDDRRQVDHAAFHVRAGGKPGRQVYVPAELGVHPFQEADEPTTQANTSPSAR